MVRHALRMVTPLLVLVLVFVPPAQADYEAGKRAWDAMRPAEALKEWRAAANAGDRRAMLALGRLYMRGLGAPQDYVEAHVWFNLAAARGELAAAGERDALAAKMTPRQIASAQERARSWRPGGSEKKQAAPSPPPRAIREAQELLAALGYRPGPADGRWGARTARAYGKFLRDAGLPRGDTLTPSGLRAMRAAARSKRPAPAVKASPRRTVRPGALHRAVLAGNIDGLKAALAAGANVNARDAQGWTTLMHAVNKGYVLMVGPLLEAKADPDVRAPDGATALFMAAVHGHSEVIELLMKGGADPSIKGPKGKTPVDVARKRYGTADAAREKNEGPALIALLEGRSWAKVVAEDDAAFARARSVGTSAAYDEYLSSQPQGRHRNEALRLKAQAQTEEEADDAAFAHARSVGTSAAYSRYLTEFSHGRHREEALRLKAQQAEVEKLKQRGWPAGEVFRECPECPEMVVIPAGTFMIGSPQDEKGRYLDEGPRHRVKIARPFAVGKYEVTFAEWDACVADSGCGGLRPSDNGWGRGRRPVMNLNWNDAKAYVEWLSKKTGEQYRLLSEAEWEYAVRAGTTTPFHFGRTISTSQANYNGNYTYGGGATGVYRGKTVPVGSFPANAFGLHDVHGNVREWVEDCWNGNYRGAPSDGSAWTSGVCSSRVLRGGSWLNFPRNLRSANRSGNSAGRRNFSNGFRVARTLDP
ncbi:MAG: SUMF1/EgtB/PvdO family nonheme iron enzyme [Nitrospinae bacterium]|nr:SUMF1/EgtB/PvdO family nonheme iron enzyme [Nitrospinota bacterium]